ncbi:hypothetical protein GCM10011428_69000 [Streptomyces violaceus]|uniref:hypothetical protein n=1 Tax=Streptomyces violaceus TaxID=1936 RepID=UPI0031E8633D
MTRVDFPGAGLADEGDGLPGGDAQVDSAQGFFVVPIGEAHVLEGDLAAQGRWVRTSRGSSADFVDVGSWSSS